MFRSETLQVEEETDIKEERSFDAASADRKEANKQIQNQQRAGIQRCWHSPDEIQLVGYRKHLLLSSFDCLLGFFPIFLQRCKNLFCQLFLCRVFFLCWHEKKAWMKLLEAAGAKYLLKKSSFCWVDVAPGRHHQNTRVLPHKTYFNYQQIMWS